MFFLKKIVLQAFENIRNSVYAGRKLDKNMYLMLVYPKINTDLKYV